MISSVRYHYSTFLKNDSTSDKTITVKIDTPSQFLIKFDPFGNLSTTYSLP